MSATSKFILIFIILAFIVEMLEAKDLKELAKTLRQKRESELALQKLEEQPESIGAEDALVRRKRQCGCGCCCCCCCCGCGGGCGRKKRDLLQVLRAKRNSISDDVTSVAANDYGYSGQTDFGITQFGTGRGGESQKIQKNNGGDEEDCAECDE